MPLVEQSAQFGSKDSNSLLELEVSTPKLCADPADVRWLRKQWLLAQRPHMFPGQPGTFLVVQQYDLPDRWLLLPIPRLNQR